MFRPFLFGVVAALSFVAAHAAPQASAAEVAKEGEVARAAFAALQKCLASNPDHDACLAQARAAVAPPQVASQTEAAPTGAMPASAVAMNPVVSCWDDRKPRTQCIAEAKARALVDAAPWKNGPASIALTPGITLTLHDDERWLGRAELVALHEQMRAAGVTPIALQDPHLALELTGIVRPPRDADQGWVAVTLLPGFVDVNAPLPPLDQLERLLRRYLPPAALNSERSGAGWLFKPYLQAARDGTLATFVSGLEVDDLAAAAGKPSYLMRYQEIVPGRLHAVQLRVERDRPITMEWEQTMPRQLMRNLAEYISIAPGMRAEDVQPGDPRHPLPLSALITGLPPRPDDPPVYVARWWETLHDSLLFRLAVLAAIAGGALLLKKRKDAARPRGKK